MKTVHYIGIFAGLAAIAGGVWFFVLRKKSPAAPGVKPAAAPPSFASPQAAPKLTAAKPSVALAPPKPIVAPAAAAPRTTPKKAGTFDSLWALGSNIKSAAQSKVGRTVLGFVPGGGAALSAIDTAEGVYGALRG